MSLFVRKSDRVVIDVVEYDKPHASDSDHMKQAVYYDEYGDRCFISRDAIFPLSKVKNSRRFSEGDTIPSEDMPMFKQHESGGSGVQSWMEKHHPTISAVGKLIDAIHRW